MKDNIEDNLKDLGFNEIEDGIYKNCCKQTEKTENISVGTTDMVNFPKHYNLGNIQTLDYIDDVLTYNPNLTALEGYYVGNILKYIGTRLGTKNDKLEDMQKAQFYLNRLIEKSGTD